MTMTTSLDPAATVAKIRWQANQRGLRRIARRVSDAWAAAKRPRPDGWCTRHLRLDKQFENRTTYDVAKRPWWKAILAAITDPEVRSVTVKASTQVGKTLTLLAAILYLAEHDPAPMMIVFPDEASTVEFRDRLYATAAASVKAGEVRRIRVPKPWRWNRRWCDLGTCRVYLAWAQARQRLRGRPCRRIFLSEVDVYEGNKNAGDPVAQSHQRTKAFHRYLHYHESSPTEAPSPIGTLEAKAATRYRWFCACPHCGHQQELRFFTHESGPLAGKGGIGGIRDAGGELLSGEKARLTAHYICEQGCKIEQTDKQRFIESGEWVPMGSQPGAKHPVGDRRTLGFHLWAIHSETQSLADLAQSYCDAVEEGKVRDWWGNMLGIEYRPKRREAQWYEVGSRLAHVHPRGTVPPEAWFLTAGLDVQADANGARYVIRGWAPGRTSWLVDWGWIERPEDSELTSLVRGDLRVAGENILQTRFPVFGASTGARNPLGKASLAVRLLNADSGHMPKQVHNWIKSLPEAWTVGEGTERVRAIKGSHQLAGIRFQKSVVEKNVRTGEEYEGGMTVWHLAVADMYPDFIERLFAPPGKSGSWHVTSDTLTLGKNYLQQVVNLERRVILDKNGRRKIEWGPRSPQIPVDFCDCEIYAEFAAEMVVGDLGWDEEAWRSAWIIPQQQANASARATVRQRADEDMADR